MAEIESFGNPLDPNNSPAAPANDSPGSEVVEHLMGRFTEWEQARSALEDKWDMYYRTWRCIEDSADATRKSEKSQLKIPATKEAINNAVDSIFQITFGADPFFKLEPVTPMNPQIPPQILQQMAKQKSDQMNLVSNYLRWLMNKDGIENKIHEALTSMAIYGTTIGQIVAKPYSRITTQREPMTGQPIPTEQTTVRPCLQSVPIQNFYIDPFAPSIAEAEGMFVKTFTKKHALAKLKKANVIQRIPVDLGTAPNDEIREDRLQRLGIMAKPGSDDVEILTYWGWLDKEQINDLPEELNFAVSPLAESEGGMEVVATIANRKHLLGLTPNPFYSQERPFVKDCYEEVPGEFYGIGIVEIANGPQRALDATVRSRIDNKALSINQLFAINVDKFLPGQNLSMYPGKVFLFRGNPSESLLPIVVPDVTSATYNDAAEYERYIQSAHGISRIVGGMPSKRGEQTATEISALMNQSNSRIKTLVASFENNFIEPMLRWYVRISFQFLNQPEVFRLFNGQLVQLNREDITEDYDFIPLGSVALNNKQEFQKRMSILQASANPTDMQFVNRPYLWQKAYETLNLNDTDIAIMGNPPPQQMMMAQQQLNAQNPQPQPQLLAPQEVEMKSGAEGDQSLSFTLPQQTAATNTSQQPGTPMIGEASGQ